MQSNTNNTENVQSLYCREFPEFIQKVHREEENQKIRVFGFSRRTNQKSDFDVQILIKLALL